MFNQDGFLREKRVTWPYPFRVQLIDPGLAGPESVGNPSILTHKLSRVFRGRSLWPVSGRLKSRRGGGLIRFDLGIKSAVV